MRTSVARLVLGVGLSVLPVALGARAVRAEPLGLHLEVARAPGSQSCPDAAEILATARQLFPDLAQAPESSMLAPLGASVTIRRTAEGHEAILTVRGRRVGQRRIVDGDSDCRGLGHALAVALVLIIGPDAEPLEMAPTVAPSAGYPRRQGRGSVTLDGGALGSYALLGGPAFGGFVGLGLWHEVGVGFRARGLRLWNLPTGRFGGEVAVDLWALMVGPCWKLQWAKRWSVYPCLELGWGSQRGVATRYKTPRHQESRKWLVLGPSLTIAHTLFGHVDGMVSAGMTARLHQQTFSIETNQGRETVVEQPFVGGYLGLGLLVRLPI